MSGLPFCPDHWTGHVVTTAERRKIRTAMVRARRLSTLTNLAKDGARSVAPLTKTEQQQIRRYHDLMEEGPRHPEYPRHGFMLVVCFALMDWQESYREWRAEVSPLVIGPSVFQEELLNVGTFLPNGHLERHDGHKPEFVARLIAANTADLSAVLRFINKRVRWYQQACSQAPRIPARLVPSSDES